MKDNTTLDEKELRKLLSRCVWEMKTHNDDSRHITDKLFIQQIENECNEHLEHESFLPS